MPHGTRFKPFLRKGTLPASPKKGWDEMFAIVETGGKQYKVEEGTLLKVERIPGEVDEEIILDRVLALQDGEELYLGNPYLQGSRVKAKIVKQGKNKKIIVFKYKAKKNYRRKKGHRQPFTGIKIQEIILEGAAEGAVD